eukprot:514955-Prorocentrum_minimum.AAC.2
MAVHLSGPSARVMRDWLARAPARRRLSATSARSAAAWLHSRSTRRRSRPRSLRSFTSAEPR